MSQNKQTNMPHTKNPEKLDSVAIITKRNIIASKDVLIKLVKYLEKKNGCIPIFQNPT